MKYSGQLLRLPLVVLVFTLSACGGGGGGGSTGSVSTPSLSYSGVSTAATIDSVNADQFVLELFDGGSIGGVAAASVTNTSQRPSTTGVLPAIKRLVVGLASLPRVAPVDRRAVAGVVTPAATINDTLLCDSGSMNISGSLNDNNGTGTLSVGLSACRLDGTLYEGRLTVSITGADLQLGEITSARYAFDDLRIQEDARRYQFAGFFDIDASFTRNTENLVMNLVFQDLDSERSVKMENLSLISQYDSLFNPSQSDVSVSGRIYDSRYGFVDISTTNLLHYSAIDDFPDSGEILLTGAGQSSLVAGVTTEGSVELRVDNDGDFDYEFWSNKPWDNLGRTTAINSAPFANAGLNQSLDKGAVAVLEGSASSDPDYDFVSFAWQLSDRPQGSQAVLGRIDSMRPRLQTDVTGDYVITLVVSDGRLSSAASQVVITALNTAPQAIAGSNRNAVPGVNEILDGQGSTDRNGDPLSYTWTLVEAPTGSTATLSGNDQAIAAFTADLPGLYTFSLVVNDSENDSRADFIAFRVADPQAASLCDTDNVSGIPASGSLLVDASLDFIPLCDGWIYFANRTSNSVDYINVTSGVRSRQYPFASSPGDLELDVDNGLLYATLAPATSIAQINVLSDQQATISLPYPPVNLAAGNDGRLFVSMDGGAWFKRPVSVVDGLGQAIVNTFDFPTDYYLDYIVFDRQDNQLIGGVAGLSPTYLYRFSFNPINDTLVNQEVLRTSGANGQDLAISPDGSRFAFPNGGGNGNGYTIFDYSSDDLNTAFGEWDTGPYPRAAAFSPFGDRLVAAAFDSLQVFDVRTHARLAEYPLDFSGCDYNTIIKVGFSLGGDIVYAYSQCGFNRDRGKLFWVVIDR